MKKVRWQENLIEPKIKRVCECQGCGKCIDPLLKSHYTFGQFKCSECKQWRCIKCITVWICRYCKESNIDCKII